MRHVACILLLLVIAVSARSFRRSINESPKQEKLDEERFGWRGWLTNILDSKPEYIITTLKSHGIRSAGDLDRYTVVDLENMGLDESDARVIMTKRELEAWLQKAVEPENTEVITRACIIHRIDLTTLQSLSSDKMVDVVGISVADAVRIRAKSQQEQEQEPVDKFVNGAQGTFSGPRQALRVDGPIDVSSLDAITGTGADHAVLLADSDSGRTVRVMINLIAEEPLTNATTGANNAAAPVNATETPILRQRRITSNIKVVPLRTNAQHQQAKVNAVRQPVKANAFRKSANVNPARQTVQTNPFRKPANVNPARQSVKTNPQRQTVLVNPLRQPVQGKLVKKSQGRQAVVKPKAAKASRLAQPTHNVIKPKLTARAQPVSRQSTQTRHF